VLGLNQGEIIEYLRKSYLASDGLWFLTVEKEYSYEEALRLDEVVWSILPKIQARKAKDLLKLEGTSVSDLAKALELKFVGEGSSHRIVDQSPTYLKIEVTSCVWLETLRKSGRDCIAQDVCERICHRELIVWAEQLVGDITVSLPSMMSRGQPACEIVFTSISQCETSGCEGNHKERRG